MVISHGFMILIGHQMEKNSLSYKKIEKKYSLWTIKTDGHYKRKNMDEDKAIYSPRWSSNGKYIITFRKMKGLRI